MQVDDRGDGLESTFAASTIPRQEAQQPVQESDMDLQARREEQGKSLEPGSD